MSGKGVGRPTPFDRFVGIKAAPFLDLVHRLDLQHPERWLLNVLLLEADHKTGRWDGTQRQLADVAHVHRTRVKAPLDRLEALQLVENHFRRGHAGWVLVLVYWDLVHRPARESGDMVAGEAARKQQNAAYVSSGSWPASNGRKQRSAASEDANRCLRDDESPGQRVGPSVLSRSSLSEPFARPEPPPDEAADRARELAEVVDISERMENNTSPPSLGVTPGRAAIEGARAALAASSSASSSMTRASAGGGSEATPVHPRSFSEPRPSIPTTVRGLRDPRAM